MSRLAALSWLLAAAMAVAGTVFPYLEWHFSGQAMTHTAWQVTAPGYSDTLLYGVPIVAGAALMAVAGVLAVRSVRLGAARLIGTGGAGLTGAATLLLFISAQHLLYFSKAEGPGFTTTVFIGPGMWLLGAASVLALSGTVFTRPPRNADDVPTPPMGIPVVRVLEPDYEEPR